MSEEAKKRRRYRGSPREVAYELLESAPDEAWIRELARRLDQAIQIAPLERVMLRWQLAGAEVGQMFGVSRQAVSQWLQSGIPAERAPAVADFATATSILEAKVKRERIPAVVRRPAGSLGGLSLLDMAKEGRHRDVRRAVESMFDLRRVQP